MRSPLTSSDMARFCTSGISSGVTSHGPSGPNVSADLALYPLAGALHLEAALGNVVAQAVAGDVRQRVLLVDIAGARADDEGDLNLPVHAVGVLRVHDVVVGTEMQLPSLLKRIGSAGMS